MAYRADIEIAVKGAQELKRLQDQISAISKKVEQFNADAARRGVDVKNITGLQSAVAQANQVMRSAAVGTGPQKQAIDAYVRSLAAAEKAELELATAIRARQRELGIATTETQKSASGGRLGGAVSSALIGGGFPLLFGQGPAAAAGGALGGLAGGLVGGGFGFALSIVGTALGDAAEKSDNLNKELARLNSQASDTSGSVQLTASDVDNLAKTFGIASDEAVKLLQSFAGFGDASTTKALAFLYGDDIATLRGLAAVKDKADLAQVILGSYEKITIQTANQLINQLKITDASTVELAFQKALLDARVRQTEEGLKQIRIQDRIVAALQTAANFTVGGTQQIVDPAIFGEGRVRDYRSKNKPSAIFTDALRGLSQLRTATQGAESFRPDKGADKAARKAAEEAKRVSELIRDRTAETELLQTQQQLQTRIFTAEQNKDAMLVARLKGEQEILNIQFRYAQELAKEPNVLAQEAIIKKGLREIDNSRVQTAQQLQAIENSRAEAVKNMIEDMDLEIAKTQAKTDAEKQAAQVLEVELQFLRQGKELTADEVKAIASKIAELEKAKKLQSETTALLRMETELFSNLASNVSSAFSSAITTAIQGTEDLGAALNNIGVQLLGTIGNMLIMYGIAQALGAAGGGVGNPEGIFSFLARGFGFGKAAEGAYWQGGFQAFADGGIVTRPTMGLVGEGGEAEYIIPASKMRGAMARYASGARGSAVIPSGGDTGGDMGGVAVGTGGAIDVRYTVERINSVDYVTADQFQRGMAQAASQGASQGEQRALKALQNNRSTRSRLGLR